MSIGGVNQEHAGHRASQPLADAATAAGGNRTFPTALEYPAYPSGQVAIADLNGDGRPDLAINTSSGANVMLNQCK
jgi:hypothetical protein